MRCGVRGARYVRTCARYVRTCARACVHLLHVLDICAIFAPFNNSTHYTMHFFASIPAPVLGLTVGAIIAAAAFVSSYIQNA